MQIRDRFSLKIESVAFGGHGIGRVEGFVIFVPFTAPGDVVEIEIVERKKKFARGRVLKIIEPSIQRIQPLCRYYGECGGCSYQHIHYESQLKIKRKQVEEAFLKIGRIAQPPVAEVIPSPRIYAYRGKAQLHAAKTAEGFKLGFMDISGGRMMDIERCEIMDETINLQIQQARTKGDVSFDQSDLIFWSDVPENSEETIVRKVKDREFLIPRTGFFQANLYLTDRMVDEVCRLMDQKKVGTIIDACCGSGLFSIFLAPYARRMIGVEINKKSVDCARLNAERHRIENTEFICGDIEEFLKDQAQKMDAVDVIILDPPRTGLSPVALAALASLASQHIIYISCNPATQARDVKFLNEHGYDLQNLQPLDMFAQTEHIETIGLLQRRKAERC
ncbi:MAG TPA: class I SAM-dependent RNA methyltransferase [Smithellaceae bacterium]|nr:class I SAM-dependent RNA methyltransferase [Smithellaceae bacterium]HPE07206.1 class I SAM-dependent RNA methyltransferase [Smithellaceae bacterium]HRY38646.1 class I SAM-dependent RNA methyltransferase [Smithellaceae bacterium]